MQMGKCANMQTIKSELIFVYKNYLFNLLFANLHIGQFANWFYSSSNFNLLRSIPKLKPLSCNTCSISLKDFWPKFLNFIRSSCSYCTSSLKELILAAFKQLNA